MQNYFSDSPLTRSWRGAPTTGVVFRALHSGVALHGSGNPSVQLGMHNPPSLRSTRPYVSNVPSVPMNQDYLITVYPAKYDLCFWLPPPPSLQDAPDLTWPDLTWRHSRRSRTAPFGSSCQTSLSGLCKNHPRVKDLFEYTSWAKCLGRRGSFSVAFLKCLQ
jgi:hypothetical protein